MKMNFKALSSSIIICSLVVGTAFAAPFRGEIEEVEIEKEVNILPAILMLLLSDEKIIVVDPSNNIPVAKAGEGDIVTFGAVSLDGSNSSDADGQSLTYDWRFITRPAGSQATLTNATTARPNFNPDVIGRYEIRLTVNDGAGGTKVDTISYVYLPCAFEPRHFQLPTNKMPTAGDAVANYFPNVNGFLGEVVGLDLIAETKVEVFVTDLDGNTYGDLVLRVPGDNKFQVWLSDDRGLLLAPVEYSMGAAPLTALIVGNLIAGGLPDIVVADSDGKVGFFEGKDGGIFFHQSALDFTEGDAVLSLAIIDLNNGGTKGDSLLVSTKTNVSLHQYDNQQTVTRLIKNGAFDQALSFWLTEAVGHGEHQVKGTIEPHNGAIVLSENESFRTTLKQKILIPDAPSTLSFDLLSVDLDDPNGGIPDAFEVSLLDVNSGSVVPTVDPKATSFLNFNPNGASTLATGTSMNGTKVTLDISSVAPGSNVTLYFDLIGNPPDSGSIVSIDNIDAGVVTTTINQESSVNLPGTFNNIGGVSSCDIGDDNVMDIIIRDNNGGGVLIYSPDLNGDFSSQQTISLEGIGGIKND